ncbi:unnamed protein product [Pylaiella littoralis]
MRDSARRRCVARASDPTSDGEPHLPSRSILLLRWPDQLHPWVMSAFEVFVSPLMQQHWQQLQQHQQHYRHSPFSFPTLAAVGDGVGFGGPMTFLRCSVLDHCRRRPRSSCCNQDQIGGMGRHGCVGGNRFTTTRQMSQHQRRSGLWLPLASSPMPTPIPSTPPTPTPTPMGNDRTPASGESAGVKSDQRMAGGKVEADASAQGSGPLLRRGAGEKAVQPPRGRDSYSIDGGGGSSSSSGVKSSTGGRIRLKWGLDVDIPVPMALEALVKGPWDTQGEVWRKQLDLAAQVIDRSGGVIFMEQLAPILNPREAPPEWYRESAAGGFSRNTGANGGITTTEVVGGDAPLLRLLFELNGTPEVTNDGDVLYIFPGFAGGDKERKGRVDKARMIEEVEAGQRSERGEAVFTATPEVLQFEELPRLLEALPNILPDQGPKAIVEFFQRTALSGLALFLSTCLLLGQLIFQAWPIWLATGPTYLIWVGLDDTLKRSRYTSAKQRDRWRGEWADVCRGDGDAVWRKRAAARSRARRLSDDGV